MKRLAISLSIASLAILSAVAVVSAAGPTPSPVAPTTRPAQAGTVVPTLLGLTMEQIHDLRVQGLTLAQIAVQQDVQPQTLIDGLVKAWALRIDARQGVGALTADQATALKAQLATRAKAMINQVPLGGMQGAAVGAGPTMRGNGGQGMAGGGRMGQGAAGAGQGAMGAGRGTGICLDPAPAATPAP